MWRVQVTWCRAISISLLKTGCGMSGNVGVMGVVCEESGVILMGDSGAGSSIMIMAHQGQSDEVYVTHQAGDIDGEVAL